MSEQESRKEQSKAEIRGVRRRAANVRVAEEKKGELAQKSRATKRAESAEGSRKCGE